MTPTIIELLASARASEGADAEARARYVEKILETAGECEISAGFNKSGSYPDFKFPKPLMGPAVYKGVDIEPIAEDHVDLPRNKRVSYAFGRDAIALVDAMARQDGVTKSTWVENMTIEVAAKRRNGIEPTP